ncbi:MlaC/ttg2D family ABC transporter substrate-binding protein [Agitococcus lubricus]|uniref:Phospholipid transport system substrate-binding protein n=1 Tax=Agitococcus lubricus TaxID=1077255 RepID=A0A2T5J0N7_9GAMM|nr:ABC transporter substrate-binding protein [Agitococcus lubricus]PTQ89908.1 phospholipid transport system substrate-binding protein [Agitococcus lubricus]
MLQRIQRVFAFLAMVSVMLAAQLTYAAENPKDFVQRISTDLTTRLVKDRAAYKKDPDLLLTIIKENIEPYVDFNGFAKGVMGQFYRQATDKQRADFTETFKKSLIRTYANGLGAYENQKFNVKPFTAGDDPKKAQVDMDIQTGSGTVIPVSYQLVLDSQGQWKVRNVILDGINLGLTFRNQFASTVESNRGNLDKAIANFVPSAGDSKKAN